MTEDEWLKSVLHSPDESQRKRIRAMVINEVEQPGESRTSDRRGWNWAVGLAGAAAIAAGVFVMVGGQSTPVWAVTPDGLTGQDLTDAKNQCQARLARLPITLPEGAGLSVLGEKRGSTSSVLLGGKDRAGFCIDTAQSGLAGIEELPPREPGAKLTVDSVPGQVGGPGATRAVYGRLAPGVTRVEILTNDDRRVTASQTGEFYLAWWPSGAGVRVVTGYDNHGQAVAVVTPPSTSVPTAPVTSSPPK